MGEPTSSVGLKLIVPVGGLYHIELNVLCTNNTTTSMCLMLNGAQTHMFARNSTYGGGSSSTLMHLNAGDALWLLATGTAPYKFGAGKTELMMTMV